MDDRLPELIAAFEEGKPFLSEEGWQSSVWQPLTTIRLPTGIITACDPLIPPLSRPFERVVPTGAYPMHVAIAEHRGYKGQ